MTVIMTMDSCPVIITMTVSSLFISLSDVLLFCQCLIVPTMTVIMTMDSSPVVITMTRSSLFIILSAVLQFDIVALLFFNANNDYDYDNGFVSCRHNND